MPPTPRRPARAAAEACRSASSCRTPSPRARWETADRPLLKQAFEAAGVERDIQNAQGDKAKFGDHRRRDDHERRQRPDDRQPGLRAPAAASTRRPRPPGSRRSTTTGSRSAGGATYYVSFDNVKVGELQGEGLVKCLGDDGRRPTSSSSTARRPTTTPRCSSRATTRSLEARSTTRRLQGSATSPCLTGTTHQAGDDLRADAHRRPAARSTASSSANDGMAQAVISVLKKQRACGKVPVTGQDATVEGLQSILARRPVHDGLQGSQAARPRRRPTLAIALIKGEEAGHHGHRQGRRSGQRRPVGAGDAGGDLQGQRQGRHRRRLPDRRRRLRRRRCRDLHRARHQLVAPGRPAWD